MDKKSVLRVLVISLLVILSGCAFYYFGTFLFSSFGLVFFGTALVFGIGLVVLSKIQAKVAFPDSSRSFLSVLLFVILNIFLSVVAIAVFETLFR